MNNLFHKDVYYIYQIIQRGDIYLFIFLLWRDFWDFELEHEMLRWQVYKV